MMNEYLEKIKTMLGYELDEIESKVVASLLEGCEKHTFIEAIAERRRILQHHNAIVENGEIKKEEL